MMIGRSRKWLIEQFDTAPVQENIIGAGRGDTHQIGPRVVIFDADGIFGHEVLLANVFIQLQSQSSCLRAK
jgi:hypothetical protein